MSTYTTIIPAWWPMLKPMKGGADLSAAGSQARFEKRYALVERVLRTNIGLDHLPEGLVLMRDHLKAACPRSVAGVSSRRGCR